MSATTTTARRCTSSQLSRLGFPPNTCRLGAGVISVAEAQEMLAAGMSCQLAITNAKGETGFYWLSVLRDRNGEVLGYRLTSDDQTGVMYDLPADLLSCECKDFQYRSRQCKHSKALSALKTRKLIP